MDKIVRVLGLDHQHVQELIKDDRRRFTDDWQRWASESVEPELRRRLMPAMWGTAPIPKGLSRDEAVEFARTGAVNEWLVYALVWSRREEIWCYPDGVTRADTMDVGQVAGPFTRLRGRGNQGFIFG